MARSLSAILVSLAIVAVSNAQSRRDIFGDPLPKGAMARLGTTRWRNVNDQNVNDESDRADIQFTPDGKSIVCLMPDGSLAGFDVISGRQNWRLRGPRHFLSFVCTPDGKTVLTGDCGPSLLDPVDRKVQWGIRVWDVANRRQIRFVDAGPIFAIRDEHVATANGDHDIAILNWKTGKLVRTLKTTRLLEGTPPMLLRGGKVAASLGYGHRGFEILDYRSGKSLKVVEPELGPSPLFYPGNIAVAYFDQKSIHRWDLSTGKELPSLSGFENEAIWKIAVTRDGKTLVSFCPESIRRWNLATGKQTGRIDPKLDPFAKANAFAVSDDGKRVAFVCLGTENLRVFDFERGDELTQPTGHAKMVTAVHFTQNGKLIVSAGEDKSLRVWDVDTGRQVLKLNSAGHVDPSGNSFVVNGAVFDLQTGRRRFAVPMFDPSLSGTFTAADVPMIVITTEIQPPDTKLELIDAISGRRRWTTVVPNLAADNSWYLPHPIRFSPSGRLVWGLWGDFGPQTLDAATGYSRGNSKVTLCTLTLSPDGRTISGHVPSDDPTECHQLGLIEAASARLRLQIDEGTVAEKDAIGCIFPPVFAPDGRLVAAVFPRHITTVFVFDTATGKLVHRFQGHSLPVTCLEFSRDGSKLVSGSEDCTAIIWNVSDIAKAHKPKTLTAPELNALWRDLASDDAKQAYRAINSLRDSGPQAIELIRARFKPQAIDLKEIERQIADLGSKDKATGDRAQTALQRIAPQIEPLLDDQLPKQLTPEARRRIEQLLTGISCFETSPEHCASCVASRCSKASAAIRPANCLNQI